MTATPPPSAVARAEAAFWLVGLHGPDRTLPFEHNFRRWLQESEEHRRAFELLSETWELSGKLPPASTPPLRVNRWRHAGYRQGFLRSAATVCGLAAVALAAFFYFEDEGLTTRIGEQRTLTLTDGTRVTLNTATRIRVAYDKQTRRVILQEGEALFDVARRTDRPFVVTVNDARITALGTTFVVRGDARQMSVTLVEGKVGVEPTPGRQSRILAVGERLTLARNAAPIVDTPALKSVTAWRNGVVDLSDTPLEQAVAEMNRYNIQRLAIEQPDAAQVPVTGLFRAGDSVNFANAVAATYGLQVVERGDDLVLAGHPVSPPPAR